MGYYHNEQYEEELIIAGNMTPGVIEWERIAIYNNDTVTLNLQKLFLQQSFDITNPEAISLIKIVIDWGDGNKTSLSPAVFTKQSTIGTSPDDWRKTSHTYHFKQEIDSTELVIKVYNTLNDLLVIIIPVDVQYKSILEYGTSFELISANITNENKVSYVINDAKEAQMIVVQSVVEDWTNGRKFEEDKVSL